MNRLNLRSASPIPHLSIGDILLFKVLLTIAMITYLFAPPHIQPYVGLGSNLAWLWRL
jgi:hypothetical protein